MLIKIPKILQFFIQIFVRRTCYQNLRKIKNVGLEGSVYLMCNDPLQHTAITSIYSLDADTKERPGNYLKLSC